MPAYDVHGNQLDFLYGLNGQKLEQAYAIDGTPLFHDDPPIGTTEIVVMSYNVGQWYNGTLNSVPSDQYETYYNLQRGFMTQNDPDIVGVQEYSETFSSGHSADKVIGALFNYSYKNNESGYQRKAMYSKHQMSDVVNEKYSGYSWGYQKGKTTIDGKDIWIFNTHLATSSTEAQKVAQSTMLLNIVANLERFIIIGDFNTVCLSVNDPEYTTIMKQFVDAGFHVGNCSPQFGFNMTWTESTDQTGTWYPCDHIITSANITIKSVKVDTSKIAVSAQNGVRIDHCPIVATLVV